MFLTSAASIILLLVTMNYWALSRTIQFEKIRQSLNSSIMLIIIDRQRKNHHKTSRSLVTLNNPNSIRENFRTSIGSLSFEHHTPSKKYHDTNIDTMNHASTDACDPIFVKPALLTSQDGKLTKTIFTTHDKDQHIGAARQIKYYSILFFTSLALALAANYLYLKQKQRKRIVLNKKTQHSLLDNAELAKAILANSPIGVCILKCNTGEILWKNQLAKEWQGTAELINITRREYLSQPSTETIIVVGDNYLEVSYKRTQHQKADILLVSFYDISKHLKALKLNTKARQDADQSNKAKTIFLATMSHEIRTPLYGLIGNLELLELTSLDNQQKKYINKIQHSTAITLEIISEILDISKIELGQTTIQAVNFCPLEIFEESVNIYLANARGKYLKVLLFSESSIPSWVRGDKSKIHQIINNLINNAIKFTDHGRVNLHLRLVDIDDKYATLKWQVSDTGSGISQGKSLTIFEPFIQFNNNKTEGAGLGLSICSKLCDIIGGKLVLVSEPGLGSSFSLIMRLPILETPIDNSFQINLKGIDIFVRAPFREIEENLVEWLNRWGASARIFSKNYIETSKSILVNMYPDSLKPLEAQWTGKQIFATETEDRTITSNFRTAEVSVYDIRAIARTALSLACNYTHETDHHNLDHSLNFNIRVLVAEDNATNREILREQLLSLGVAPTMTSDGWQALAEWNIEPFDMIITDVNMPNMDGYELAKNIRQQGSSVPIIGVTANAMREEGEKCLRAGMDAWLIKPLRINTLRETLMTHTRETQAKKNNAT